MLFFPVVGFAWDLTNPGADKLVGWDNSAPAGTQTTWFGAGTGLEFNGTDIQVKLGTTAATVSEGDHGHSGVYELVGVAAGLDHAAVTLDVDAAVIFDLSTQEIGLDVQTANTVFAGPDTGAANEPTFRALVAADIPDISATYQAADADLDSAAGGSAAGNSKFWGTDGAGEVGWIDQSTIIGTGIANGTAVGQLTQWDGDSWEPIDELADMAISGGTLNTLARWNADTDLDTGSLEWDGTAPYKSVFVHPGAFKVDGTNCAAVTSGAINSGPYIYYTACTDAAGTIDFQVGMPENWDGGSLFFEPHVFSAEGTPAGTINFLASIQVRASDAVINNTWNSTNGAIYFEDAETANSEPGASDQYKFFKVKNKTAIAASGAGGSILFGRLSRVADAGAHTTSTQAIRVMGIKMFYVVDNLSEKD